MTQETPSSTPTAPTATAIALAVRAGHLTARTAAEQALARIARTETRVGAYQVIRTVRALAEADAVDARAHRDQLTLAGVPIAVKDNVAVSGEPQRKGSAGSDPQAESQDHEVVRRLREAGAVVVGITRVPELCVFGTTDSTYGITRNPWDLQRSPGGSSGGRRQPSPQARFRSRTATTGWDRSGSPPRAAVWSGSSPALEWSPHIWATAPGSTWPRTVHWRPPWTTRP